MAKPARGERARPIVAHSVSSPVQDSSLLTRRTGLIVATAMLAVAIVYVGYWTHDSIDLQLGSARYLVAWLVIAAGLAMTSCHDVSRADWWIDALAWSLAGWMTLSLVANAAYANVRLGINELGWWIATAALVTLARRVATQTRVQISLMYLVIAVSIGVAIFGWYQSFVDMPQLIAAYRADPDSVLRKAGIDAEAGSAMRIVFENRLYDGGPTGTFALANSMAALLVGGLIAALGMALVQWSSASKLRRAAGTVAIVLIGGMVLASRSRSAVVAFGLIAAWIAWRRWNRMAKWSLVAVALVAILAAAYAYRNSEWIEQAPASLAIRLNYWKSSLAMANQSPIVGVGPGQFKAAYELFRAPTSTEQIADPHQFLLQTLATGGWLALILFVTLMTLLVRQATRKDQPQIEPTPVSGVVIYSALLAVGSVWIFGAAIGQTPMLGAGLVASSGAMLLIALMATPRSNAIVSTSSPISLVAALAVAAITIDLLAAGGLTVPGVSVIGWTLVGIASPVTIKNVSVKPTISRLPIAMGLAISLVLIAWYGFGIRPIERAQPALNRFDLAWSRGQIDVAIETLEQAATADRWSPEPVLRLAGVMQSLAVTDTARQSQWLAGLKDAEGRSLAVGGRDPVMMRQLGDGRLVVYQRFGDKESLELARDFYQSACRWSPSHEAYAAQLAEILRELGDDRATDWAKRAAELAQLGGYYERRLDFTILLRAKHYGPLENGRPVREPAAKVLTQL